MSGPYDRTDRRPSVLKRSSADGVTPAMSQRHLRRLEASLPSLGILHNTQGREMVFRKLVLLLLTHQPELLPRYLRDESTVRLSLQ